MPTNKDIDDLVSLLDAQMNKGVNKVNVEINSSNLEELSIETGADCCSGDSACKIPNIDLGLDEEEN